MRSSKHFQKSMWTLSKYAINSLLHFIDIFSVTGLEFVNKILSYSCKSIETHGEGNKLMFCISIDTYLFQLHRYLCYININKIIYLFF